MRRTRALVIGVLLVLVPPTPAAATAPRLTVTLDGRLATISQVANSHCEDTQFPTIRCYRNKLDRDRALSVVAAQTQALAAAGVIYVTVYDQSAFGGSSFSISQDYDTLATIGWNDRVSSFKGKNAETGRFYVDWMRGGSGWNFCCNQQTGFLSTYDNTFSSVYRT